ncbi:MAG: DUF3109 family protein [Bacteroidota bacterium]
MFIIGAATIEDTIAHERFACDLRSCEGACCTIPGCRGAPLEDSELDEIARVFPVVKKYLSDDHLRAAEKFGVFEGRPGSYATTCINGRDCIFVFYEDGVARCSIEKAYNSGEIRWRKPMSCHLFPIRISSYGEDRLRYEKISECKPALTRGRTEEIPLYDFLKGALVRRFGQKWYDEFRAECIRRESSAL